ncbi:AzlC family ABC transporter permease [Phreatobacter sp. AB_2022a]|uniref:AzlC family ABC transporter permease n=1 Tax=Phreatobacter sp. AB_2022a TaxID=3003134 RepID=UPI0022875E97|nr:AzlC family ABC transporter permease [Phreatobacter sp. AB_2022a]MCZ0736210.1 AzlC family ABC transporter permease [Phreatobacter sp. AB_2022a]
MTITAQTGSSRPVTFTLAGLAAGARAAQALASSTFVYGIAFGLVAGQAGLSIIEALLMSAAVYSGSAQLAALSVLGHRDGGFATAGLGTAFALAATILLMNARYLLYGATLRPWLGALPGHKAYLSLFFLGDGNWLLAMKEHASGRRDAAFVLGSGLVMFAGWLAGTLLGEVAGHLIPSPSRLGFDFLIVAFAAAMAVGMFDRTRDTLPLIAATAAASVASLLAPAGWAVVAAGLAGAATAAIRAPAEAA